jgi:spermidine synthase
VITRRTLSVALLLFGSGACALVYQIVWLRELRLVFGASTAATSTVLGIFMGGLGLGGAILGRRVDLKAKPLDFYSKLEFSIAVIAAITPFLIAGARLAYLATGGLPTLGLVGATLLRLLLSTVVLGVATFLMGGTLPAAVRSVETDQDIARRNLAVLYGANTLGAVFGAFASTFWMLELFGTRNTLWFACAVNALIALKAREMSRSMPSLESSPNTEPEATGAPDTGYSVPATFVYIAAGIVGFAFLLMELVWYRMLASILGGTTYTFGLILVVALLGIGVGGAMYAIGRGAIRPTVTLFTVTCALEALLIGLPFAFGDGIAVFAGLMRVLVVLGFPSLVLGWIVVAAIVIFPAALVAGYQFPLLIGLLGSGRTDVGRHVGTAYAWNTAGAIAGSIVGGFVLLPSLTAPGCWRLVVGLLVILAVGGMVVSLSKERRITALATTAVVCGAAIATIGSEGPTAVWRHSGIGAGRASVIGMSKNELDAWKNRTRRTLVLEAEGLEMSVGMTAVNGLSFIVNGKNDGNARRDASTQVGSGLISAVLHPAPRHALVVGLGTGSTSGWLARIPAIERVDSVELEPAIVEVARMCTAVNADVLDNPKSDILLADGREILLSTDQGYDLIVSEPSNPYRAGIASLYTTEFYRAVADRLRPGGLFTQWLQAYEVDTQTVRTVVSTLGSVFPFVEVWQTNAVDMMFVCSVTDPGPLRVDRLRRRLSEEPFEEAMSAVWGTHDAEGFLAHFVAGPQFTREIAVAESRINTDDRMLVEFGFARTVGRRMGFNIEELRLAAIERGLHRPEILAGAIDWDAVETGRLVMHALLHRGIPPGLQLGSRQKIVREYYDSYLEGEFDELRQAWATAEVRPRFDYDLAIFATALAESANPASTELIRELEKRWPLEAAVIAARYQWRSGDPTGAAHRLATVFAQVRTNPWIHAQFLESALDLSRELVALHPELAQPLFDGLSSEFVVAMEDERRLQTLLAIASFIGPLAVAEVLHGLEPHVPWEHSVLVRRLDAYEATGDSMVEHAREDLARFLAQAPEQFRNP